MATIDERLEKLARSLETLEQTETRHNEAADNRMTRIENDLGTLVRTVNDLGQTVNGLALTLKRIGKFAMVIARIHEDELASHSKRLEALEAEFE